jgi:hypothetical protein
VRVDVALELLVDGDFGLGQLLASGFPRQALDQVHELLDRGVRRLQGMDRFFFGHFVGARFDHDDAVPGAGDDEIEATLLSLRERRIDDVLAIDQADSDGGHGLFNGNLRQRERGAGAGQRQHIRIVFGIGRQHERDHLRLVVPAGGEQRPNRPVDHAARQRFLFGGLAFALEEAAGNAAGGIGVFAVVDGERQEIDSFTRARGVTRRDEHHRVADADDDAAVGLFGEPARLDRQGV